MKVFILLFILIIAGLAKEDKCRILSFSSGTEKGAYQVGALKALIENLSEDDVKYTVLSGVSFGAFNAAIASLYKVGDEKAMINELYGIWKNTKDIDIYQNWWGGAARGALYKGGLYDSTPWIKYLNKVFDGRNAEREVMLGAVNVKSGKYHDLTDLMEEEKLQQAVAAATAVTIFFPPVTEFGEDWFDGGSVWPIDVIGPIRKCELMGFAREDIIVDVLMTNSDVLPPRDTVKESTITSALRFMEITDFYLGVDGIARALYAFEKVNFRYCVSPNTNYLPTDWFPFSFSQGKVDKLLERGYADAMKTIEKGPNNDCINMVKTVKSKKKLQNAPKQLDDLIKKEVS
jgi:predicted acylesterase/phospholipase RssA